MSETIMDLTDWLDNESRDESFDPGVLDVESFLTEEQEERLLTEYAELINNESAEDDNPEELP